MTNIITQFDTPRPLAIAEDGEEVNYFINFVSNLFLANAHN